MHSEFHNIAFDIWTTLWITTYFFVGVACFMKCGFVLVHVL